MAVTVIESAVKARLDAFKGTADFLDLCGQNARIREGAGEGRDDGLAVHWILIEDDRDEDNATYRVTEDGLQFWASGVEV